MSSKGYEINKFKYFWPLKSVMTVENYICEIKNYNKMKNQYLSLWTIYSESISHIINGKNTVTHEI